MRGRSWCQVACNLQCKRCESDKRTLVRQQLFAHAEFGKPDVDLFASSEAHQLMPYVAEHWDGKCVGVNAWAQDCGQWPQENSPQPHDGHSGSACSSGAVAQISVAQISAAARTTCSGGVFGSTLRALAAACCLRKWHFRFRRAAYATHGG